MLYLQAEPNSKSDVNNVNPVSTDFVGYSLPYLTNNAAGRAVLIAAHRDYILGLIYFLANDPSVPSGIRTAMAGYGYAKDEFTDSSNFPATLYVREGRRMVSDYVLTQSNVIGAAVARDGISVAAYGTDSHSTVRFVQGTNVAIEGGFNNGTNPTVPWPVAYRAIVPRTNDCGNLLVPWAISATHVAYSSFRLEPSFMAAGQAAGVAAVLAIASNCPVQSVNVAVLKNTLVANGQVTCWDITNGLQGWWKFTETSGSTTADSQSNNVGTLVNGPTFGFMPDGRETAMSFSSASSQYVKVGANNALSGGVFTYCAWVDPADLTAIYPVIAGTNTAHAEFRLNSGGLLRLIDEGNGGSIGTSVGGVAAGVMTFVAVTFDGANAIFYTNGIAASGSLAVGGTGYVQGTTTIGGTPVGSQYFNGLIADARIYNRKLSAAEIFTLWLNGAQ